MIMENAKLKNNILLSGKEKHEVETIETKKPVLFELLNSLVLRLVMKNQKLKNDVKDRFAKLLLEHNADIITYRGTCNTAN